MTAHPDNEPRDADGWLELERDGLRLAVRDFGGDGPAVLLLYGLAGHAGEWDETASQLTPRHRVLAIEARGHGRSERRPAEAVGLDLWGAWRSALLDFLVTV